MSLPFLVWDRACQLWCRSIHLTGARELLGTVAIVDGGASYVSGTTLAPDRSHTR